MKAYSVTINKEELNNTGSSVYFSSYKKACDYIFKEGYDFYFRGTDIPETSKSLKERLHEGYFETIRREAQTWEAMPWLEKTIEYCHISIITIK